jgi:hypothetical protein
MAQFIPTFESEQPQDDNQAIAFRDDEGQLEELEIDEAVE